MGFGVGMVTVLPRAGDAGSAWSCSPLAWGTGSYWGWPHRCPRASGADRGGGSGAAGAQRERRPPRGLGRPSRVLHPPHEEREEVLRGPAEHAGEEDLPGRWVTPNQFGGLCLGEKAPPALSPCWVCLLLRSGGREGHIREQRGPAAAAALPVPWGHWLLHHLFPEPGEAGARGGHVPGSQRAPRIPVRR